MAVLDLLGENAVLVPDAIAIGGHAQGSHGVQETGGQAPQAAVAEASIFLDVLELLDVETQLVESLVAGWLDAKVDHGVGEGAAHVVLEREVVHPLQKEKNLSEGTSKAARAIATTVELNSIFTKKSYIRYSNLDLNKDGSLLSLEVNIKLGL